MIKFSIISYRLVAGTCTHSVRRERNSHVRMHFCFYGVHTFKKVFCKTEFVSVWILADKKIQVFIEGLKTSEISNIRS